MEGSSQTKAQGQGHLPLSRLTHLSLLLILLVSPQSIYCWDNAEFEMFDLVEEVGQNFYEFLGVTQDAGAKEIRQAYRQLTVKLHPDKNPAEDADLKFRQLVGIYEVLKDAELRESYNRVLVEGLPNWRQPMYYYRRARKLALWQVAVIVLVIVSIGQYLAGWASYWEKRLSVQEMIDTQIRRTQRKRKAQKEGPTHEELQAEAEKFLRKPSLWDLAPFQLMRLLKYLVVGLPRDSIVFYREWELNKQEEKRRKILEAEEAEREKLIVEEPKKPRKRKKFEVSEKEGGDPVAPAWGNTSDGGESDPKSKAKAPPVVSGGLWTDEDISELVRLCSKFPGGTPERWEKIASSLCRPVNEVTFMAKKVLDRLSKKEPEEEEEKETQVKVKVKTKGGKNDALDRLKVENWTPEEQKALENALGLYPKGSNERWDRIANMIPGRTKEECMQRFKYIADLVKKKKEEREEVLEGNEGQSNPDAPSEGQPTASSSPPEKEPQREKAEDEPVLTRQGSDSSSSSTNSDQDWCIVEDASSLKLK